ncbi:AAA family ATPase [candidate division CSSED10-310 bacterium]|uniref:AAA family ATPase n=1 Tax=candidate division CSSED10-310 bacterium TaxID=2855610 RepID=A0ABV6Z4G6_UNCC1
MTRNKLYSGTSNYVASAELQEIVYVAITLERPLLVRGEPGTGKTLLATSIAESLALPIITWFIKSTSKAQEGLYTYDTVQRLNDSRFGDGDIRDIRRYIKLGPLGRAFQNEKQTVVLIDEIDKADLEFPNDLLNELDVMEFEILETGDLIKAKQRPIVIITSNAEKELPDAFLRRCIFHYITFPTAELMSKIIAVHHPKVSEKLIAQCLNKFYWLREQTEISKLPSTSELIDWIAALVKGGVDLKVIETEFPFLGTLLKKENDFLQIKKTNRPSWHKKSS